MYVKLSCYAIEPACKAYETLVYRVALFEQAADWVVYTGGRRDKKYATHLEACCQFHFLLPRWRVGCPAT